MAIEITIPRLGWSMDEGTFGEWVKRHGDFVEAGEPVFLLETDKALQEVESVDSGFLHIVEGGPNDGDTVRVGTVVAWLLEKGEEPPAAPLKHGKNPSEKLPAALPATPAANYVPPATVETKNAADKPACDYFEVAASPSVRRLARQLNVNLTTNGLTGTLSENDVRRLAQPARQRRASARDITGGDVPQRNSDETLPRVSPRAARTARRLGIDWSCLQGSGSSGRICEKDVLAAAGVDSIPEGAFLAPSSTRKIIAERMSQSARTTVPVTLTSRADVSELLADRTIRKERAAADVIIPAIHDYVIHAAARALGEYSVLNSRWMNGEILKPDGIHVGIAVDTEAGLIVPVVRDADRKSLEELAADSSRLIKRARQRRLTRDDVTGGTFTISNLGALGVDAFTPVINPGESAILGLGAIRRTAEPSDDGSLHWVPQMTLSLTFNHRVTDGAPSARFLQRVAELLAESQRWQTPLEPG